MQPVDLTTLRALQQDLAHHWLPARVETLQQIDLWTVCLCLRTLQARIWVLVSWHPQAARTHLCAPPPKASDPFQFSQSLQRQLKGLALIDLQLADPWERVLEWRFARRPGDEPVWRLYLEVMGRYSNAVLVDRQGMIFACGHGVSERQSSVRPVQPGLPYQSPPALMEMRPSLEESFDRWQETVSLIPGPVAKRILKAYRGVSGSLVGSLLQEAGVAQGMDTTDLSREQWRRLFEGWREWLQRLEQGSFVPGWTRSGYTVLGWDLQQPADSIHTLLETYYGDQLHRETFSRERLRLQQKLRSALKKLYHRRDQFQQKLHQSDQADEAKHRADLLMAHLQAWQPGLDQISLPDFETGEPIPIPLDPELNAVSNAQLYYKRHRKQKRARNAVLPLWQAAEAEIQYLEQVEDALEQLDRYRSLEDLQTLEQIRGELIQQNLLSDPQQRTPAQPTEIAYRRFQTPRGLEIWVGRNNHQNDQLTFRVAQDTDWWFHAQEIPGSHVLLRLPPGEVAEDQDLQVAADLAAYFSRARLSEQVPVVYTRPKHVHKPKGSLPGMVIYKQETVMWAQPNREATLQLVQSS